MNSNLIAQTPASIPFSRRDFLRTAVLGGAGMVLAGCQSSNPSRLPGGVHSFADVSPAAPAAALPSIPRAGIIDTHMHVVAGNPDLKPGVPETDRLMTAAPAAKAQFLSAELQKAEVACAFAMGHQGGQGDDPLGIASTLEVAGLLPELRAVGIADPRRTSRAHLQAVERQIVRERGRLAGFKAYLGYIHAMPNDPGYEPYYRLAAKYSLPFVFHTGDTWSLRAKLKFAHPLGVDEVATDHPEVRFVLAHLGVPWHLDAAEVISKNDNVWADLSGLYVGDEKALDDVLKQDPRPDAIPLVVISDVKKALTYAQRFDRILYGSDWPLAPMAAYRRFIEAIIPREHHEKVLRTNAERLFFG